MFLIFFLDKPTRGELVLKGGSHLGELLGLVLPLGGVETDNVESLDETGSSGGSRLQLGEVEQVLAPNLGDQFLHGLELVGAEPLVLPALLGASGSQPLDALTESVEQVLDRLGPREPWTWHSPRP